MNHFTKPFVSMITARHINHWLMKWNNFLTKIINVWIPILGKNIFYLNSTGRKKREILFTPKFSLNSIQKITEPDFIVKKNIKLS